MLNNVLVYILSKHTTLLIVSPLHGYILFLQIRAQLYDQYTSIQLIKSVFPFCSPEHGYLVPIQIRAQLYDYYTSIQVINSVFLIPVRPEHGYPAPLQIRAQLNDQFTSTQLINAYFLCPFVPNMDTYYAHRYANSFPNFKRMWKCIFEK